MYSEDLYNFIKNCLELNPGKRSTAVGLIKNKYLQKNAGDLLKIMIKTIKMTKPAKLIPSIVYPVNEDNLPQLNEILNKKHKAPKPKKVDKKFKNLKQMIMENTVNSQREGSNISGKNDSFFMNYKSHKDKYN